MACSGQLAEGCKGESLLMQGQAGVASAPARVEVAAEVAQHSAHFMQTLNFWSEYVFHRR